MLLVYIISTWNTLLLSHSNFIFSTPSNSAIYLFDQFIFVDLCCFCCLKWGETSLFCLLLLFQAFKKITFVLFNALLVMNTLRSKEIKCC